MRKPAYLFVYLLPLTVLLAFWLRGYFTFMPVIIFYGLVPLLELLIQPNHHNPPEVKQRQNSKYFDWVLYLAVPVQAGVLICFLIMMSQNSFTTLEYIGLTVSMGLMCGVFGINIAHELGHRHSWYERLLAEVLLLTSLEMHFIPYHNNGHHHNVATPNDPATARKNEPLYWFWFRSQIGSYFQAWQLEKKRLAKQGKAFLSPGNRMLTYTLVQIAFLWLIFYLFGTTTLLLFLAAAGIGILQLETVNYIEHYGLLRQKNADGRYERVRHHHSWNSDHVIGRAMLFELSRHSDHHYKASKKYQTLISVPASPQMPTGYPGMMLFAMLPPLWFNTMNRKLAMITPPPDHQQPLRA